MINTSKQTNKRKPPESASRPEEGAGGGSWLEAEPGMGVEVWWGGGEPGESQAELPAPRGERWEGVAHGAGAAQPGLGPSPQEVTGRLQAV